MKDISIIIGLLEKEYCVKDSETEEIGGEEKNPFFVLISCLLSLRTKDKVTGEASKRLLALAKTPEEMLKLSTEQIEKPIYPVGFYKTKTKRIKQICKDLVEKYNSEVPNSMEELLNLKGVGRKTANIVVTMAFNKPGIAVDTHVHRICNRLGLVSTKKPEDTETELRKQLPKKYWIFLNSLLVTHGKKVCTPISPKCGICPIEEYCKKVGVLKSR